MKVEMEMVRSKTSSDTGCSGIVLSSVDIAFLDDHCYAVWRDRICMIVNLSGVTSAFSTT